MIANNRKTLLVIGGTGFIGFHLLKKSINLGWTSYSASRKKPFKKKFLKKVRYISVDIKKLKDLENKLNQNYDFVVNLSNLSYSKNKSFLNFINKKKIKKYIQVGSSAEYGKNKRTLVESLKCKPISAYGKNKLKNTKDTIEIYKNKSFPSIVVRLFQVYGPLDDDKKIIPFTIKNCLKNRNFNLTQGFQTRDFCHIDDVVNAIVKLLKTRNTKVLGKIFNIGSGKSISIKKLVEKINRKIGKGFPVFGKKKISIKEITHSRSSIKKIKKHINWSPKISLDKGIEDLVKYEK